MMIGKFGHEGFLANGRCEPRPPVAAGKTRLNHYRLRGQGTMVESARLGVGSTQG